MRRFVSYQWPNAFLNQMYYAYQELQLSHGKSSLVYTLPKEIKASTGIDPRLP